MITGQWKNKHSIKCLKHGFFCDEKNLYLWSTVYSIFLYSTSTCSLSQVLAMVGYATQPCLGANSMKILIYQLALL